VHPVHYLAEGTMSQIGAPFVGSYDYGEVARSILIAIFASYAALDLGGRVTAARGWARAAWLTGGAIAMGIGIWAMHFKALLAFRLPVKVDYHWPTVLVSLLIAVLASAVALYVATRQEMGPVQAWTGSLVMGCGIAAMHYVGMASMRLAAVTRFDFLLVALSVVLAIFFSRIALMFTFDYREDFRGTTLAKVISAAVMGAAISLMHYTGMAAVSFMPAAVFPNPSNTVSISSLGNNGIAIVTFLVVGTAILTSSVDRQAQVEVERINERLELRVVERTRQLTAANEELRKEIAERQRAEDALRRSEDRLRLVLDTTPALILSARPDGYIDYLNQRWLEYVGLSLGQVQGWAWTTAIHPEDVEETVAKWRATLANGKPLVDEARMRRADGEYRWMLFRRVPLLDEHGNIVKWYGSGTDIEDLKREEDARRQVEEQHRIVVETATDAIISINEDSQILFVNPATTTIFSHESSELIGQPLTMLMPEFLRELHKTGFQHYLATGQRHMAWQGVELIGLRKNREQFPVEISFGEVVKQGHHVFTGFIRDITDRKRVEDKLRQLSGRLLRLQDEERRRIARDLHDSTGQDLVALATMLGQLRDSISSSDRKSRRLLSDCQALADRCIREVRTLSYLLHPPVLDQAGLGDAIREYADGFAKRSGIQVELEISRNLGRMARDTELALFRVVQESLTNIQRHSGSQQARIRIDRASDLTLEISDRGRGVSDAVTRGKEERRLEMGVGIPSMQERVKLIGGRLDIESSSRGTTVRVTIPLAGEPT
jgi:PAS domain S-box-containing protein